MSRSIAMTRTTRVYGGVAADQRRSARHDRLLSAAFELLARDGAQGLTIRKIAAAAGVSTRYVYEDFVDLEDLRCQAFDRAAEEVGVLAVEAAATVPKGDTRGQLTAVIEVLFDFVMDQPAKARLLLTDAYGDPVLAARRTKMSEVFARGFSFYVRDYLRPDLPDSAVQVTARAIIGSVAEIATAWVSGSLAYDKATLVEHQVEFVLGALNAIAHR